MKRITLEPSDAAADSRKDDRGGLRGVRPTFESPGTVLKRLAARSREREPLFAVNGWSEEDDKRS